MSVIFIVAGEPSGDLIGARCMRACRALAGSAVSFVGIGGPLMEGEGLASLFPMRDLSVMGFSEVLRHIPLLLRRIRETVAAIRRIRPDMLLTIDSPGFCWRVAAAFQNDGSLQKWHYVAPTVWAYKPGRVHTVKKLYDGLLTVLPFEKPYFDAVGLPTYYVGNPVIETEAELRGSLPSREEFLAAYGTGAGERVAAIMPGSREGEIAAFGEALSGAVSLLAGKFPCRAFFLTLPHLREAANRLGEKAGCAYRVVTDEREKRACRAHADVALIKSGTSTLEQTLYDSPALVCYKASPLSAFLLRRMIRTPYVSLPNVIANAPVLPELLQENCRPDLIASCALELMENPEKAEAQREGMRRVLDSLRVPGGSAPSFEAAKIVLGHALTLPVV